LKKAHLYLRRKGKERKKGESVVGEGKKTDPLSHAVYEGKKDTRYYLLAGTGNNPPEPSHRARGLPEKKYCPSS